MAGKTAVVVVLGYAEDLRAEDSVAQALTRLGADVRSFELWTPPEEISVIDAQLRAIVIEAGDRPDLAVKALRALQKDPRLETVPSLVAISERQVARLEPSAGFDDFIVAPYFAAEIYARIRALEWKASDFVTEERLKVGDIVIDRASHDVSVNGHKVTLTAKEFALLVFLSQNRGRVFGREALLSRVWGSRYEGGARTVDIHVRRLRMKLGDAFPLETLRGAGYKLRAGVKS